MTVKAANKIIIPMAAIVSLDIQGDPLYAWTGHGNLIFGDGNALGPEMFNKGGNYLGNFDVASDVTSADIISAGLAASSNAGQLLLVSQPPPYYYERIVWILSGLTEGKTYKVTGTLVSGNVTNWGLLCGIYDNHSDSSMQNQFAQTTVPTAPVNFSFTFVAINNGYQQLRIYTGGPDATSRWDNISIKEVTGFPSTGDPSLDGKTFSGLGDILEINTVSEGVGGSDGLEITFPGVDLNDTMMQQVIRDRDRWQFRRAIVWLMLLDPVTFLVAGQPFRIKTGRIDSMPFEENNEGGTIKCVIEGQQSSADEPLNTRYSEQIDINANDTSQKYIYQLANMSAIIGKSTTAELNQAIVVGNTSPIPGETGGGGGAAFTGGGSGGGYGYRTYIE